MKELEHRGSMKLFFADYANKRSAGQISCKYITADVPTLLKRKREITV
jgi:hypothetical protein